MNCSVPASPSVESGLRSIGALIDDLAQGHGLPPGFDPTSNTGAEVHFPNFTIAAYCWCDGERHPDDCPPNFEYPSRDISVEWYKYLGRETMTNRKIAPKEWAEVQSQCLKEVVECMSNYEFVRRNLLPNVGITAFSSDGTEIEHPTAPPPIFTTAWKGEDYLFRVNQDGSAYECHLLEKCPKLKIGPPTIKPTEISSDSLWAVIPTAGLGFQLAAGSGPDAPHWGNWIDTKVFNDFLPPSLAAARVPATYQEPDEDTLDYLRFCEGMDSMEVE